LKKQCGLIEEKDNQYYVECEESSISEKGRNKNPNIKSGNAESQVDSGGNTLRSSGNIAATELENTL